MPGFNPEDLERLNALVRSESEHRAERELLAAQHLGELNAMNKSRENEIKEIHGLFSNVHRWALDNHIPHNGQATERWISFGVVRSKSSSGWTVFDDREFHRAEYETKADYTTGHTAVLLPNRTLWWSDPNTYRSLRQRNKRNRPFPMEQGVDYLTSYYGPKKVREQLFNNVAALALNAGVSFE